MRIFTPTQRECLNNKHETLGNPVSKVFCCLPIPNLKCCRHSHIRSIRCSIMPLMRDKSGSKFAYMPFKRRECRANFVRK